MNERLQQFARQTILTELALLPETWQEKFRLMYGRNNGKRSVEETKKMGIKDIVAEIPADKLDWAMQQVENSLKKLS